MRGLKTGPTASSPSASLNDRRDPSSGRYRGPLLPQGRRRVALRLIIIQRTNAASLACSVPSCRPLARHGFLDVEALGVGLRPLFHPKFQVQVRDTERATGHRPD